MTKKIGKKAKEAAEDPEQTTEESTTCKNKKANAKKILKRTELSKAFTSKSLDLKQVQKAV